MAESLTGKRNPNWRGGRSRASNGYVLLRVGIGHHLADVRGYAYEHRVVAEVKIGRRLLPGEEVHHVNGIKDDNRAENIEIVTKPEHALEHRSPKNKNRLRMPGEENPIVCCACGCGSAFSQFDETGRPRTYVSGHNVTRNSKGQFEVEKTHG